MSIEISEEQAAHLSRAIKTRLGVLKSKLWNAGGDSPIKEKMTTEKRNLEEVLEKVSGGDS